MNCISAYAIICGMPRCGTRQFTDFLNRDERICIQAEISNSLIPYLYNLMMKTDDVYKQGKHHQYLIQKRYKIITDLFALFSKGRIKQKEGSHIQGFKTPRIESHHEKLNAMILPSTDRITYLYCIRNIKDCFLSLSAMPWFGYTPERFIATYLKSLKTATEIHAQTKKSNVNISISILNLDDFIAVEDKAKWVIHNLYQPLGLKLHTNKAIKYLETSENTNSTVRITGNKRATSLPSEIEKIFNEHQKSINNRIIKFNRIFKENLVLL